MKKFLPVIIFVLLVALLAFGLTNDPKKVPSVFIGKPAPEFRTDRLFPQPGQETISNRDMLGRVWILNVFASWCASCRVEHKVISQLTGKTSVPVVGLNYKDEAADAKKWLAFFGNPYYAVAVDYDGKIGIEYGVYGVPETFVIDKKGFIRHKETGPVNEQIVAEVIQPLIAKLERE